MTKTLKIDKLEVTIYETSEDLGKAAADFVQRKLSDTIAEKGNANMILATGASQFEFLDALKEKNIEWQKITVFHLDEYKNISDSHPASFRKYLKDRILNAVKPREIYFLNGDADDVEGEMNHYSEALKNHPIDIACIGIGENGHIAFNDPPCCGFS